MIVWTQFESSPKWHWESQRAAQRCARKAIATIISKPSLIASTACRRIVSKPAKDKERAALKSYLIWLTSVFWKLDPALATRNPHLARARFSQRLAALLARASTSEPVPAESPPCAPDFSEHHKHKSLWKRGAGRRMCLSLLSLASKSQQTNKFIDSPSGFLTRKFPHRNVALIEVADCGQE